MKQYPTKHKPHIPKQRSSLTPLTLERADFLAEVLKQGFADVVIDGSGSQPVIRARDHNRAWTPQRMIVARLEGKRKIIAPMTQASRLR